MNENYDVNFEGDEEVMDAKLTFKEKVKSFNWKKALKVVGIGAGAIAGTMVLGKFLSPDEPDLVEDALPFDEGATE